MATQVTTSTQPANSTTPRAVKVQAYVDKHLEKTRRQVKTVDLITNTLGLLGIVLAFFLVLAMVDAWVWSFGFWGRAIALTTLIVGSLAYCWMYILPLMIRKINPEYAAKMIEEAKPTFKNSLLNYLSLRQRAEKTRRAVYDAVANQAAQNLSQVPKDSTVDRANLVRVGFFLVGVTAAIIFYAILSPKNPLQTVKRILLPGSELSQPAIVQIKDVQPGDTEVFFGDRLDVTAEVRGQHEPNDVKIKFSTNDGQIVDAVIPMEAVGGGLYKGQLATDAAGIQQALTYQVVARDGYSPVFNVAVRPNPTISVQSLVMTPPSYTKLPTRTLNGIGDVAAVEGTRIDINAIANLPIQLAYIELLNEVDDGNFSVVGQAKSMEPIGNTAKGSFVCVLSAKRDKPLFTHYRINFVSTSNDRNSNPNVYPVRITPDLAPEIEIIEPTQREIKIPLNKTLNVDILANDLDFEISSIDLHIDHVGTKLLDADLHLDSKKGNQRVTARQVISPQELNLKVGDRAIFYATASDNRTSPYSDQPEPNVSRSENFTLIVTDPVELSEEEKKKQEEQKNKDEENKNGQQDPEQNKDDQENQKPDENNKGDEDNGKQEEKDPNAENKEDDGKTGEDSDKGENKDKNSDSSDQKDPNKSADNQSNQNSKDPSNDENKQAGNDKQEKPDGQNDDQAKQENGGDKSQQKDGAQESQDQNSQDGKTDQNQSPQKDGQDPSSSNKTESGTDVNSKGSSGGEGKDENGGSDNRGDEGNGGNQPENSDPSNPDGVRDNNLGDGDSQPVDESASDGERMERLKKWAEDQKKKQEQDKGQPGEQDPNKPNQEDQAENKQQGDESKQGEQGGQDKQQGDQSNQGEQGGQDKQQGDESKQGEQGGQDKQQGDQSKQGEQGEQGEQGGQDKQQGDQSKQGEQGGQDKQQGDQSKQGEQGGQDKQQGDQSKQGEQGGQDKQQGDQSKQGEQGGQDKQQGDQSKQGEQGGQDKQQVDQSKQGEQGGQDKQQGDQSKQGEQGGQDKQQGDQSKQGEQGGQDKKQGDGSKKGDGSKPGDQNANGPDKKPADANGKGDSSSGQPPKPTGQGNKSDKPGNRTGPSPGGRSGKGGLQGDQALEREEANLDYTKKATDLVLEQLEKQRENPDPELLKDMNWDKDKLNKFLDRWKEMKQAAESGNTKNQKEYEEVLKSLGLSPKSDQVRKIKSDRDELFGLSEDAADKRAPDDIAEDFNVFLKERNRVKK